MNWRQLIRNFQVNNANLCTGLFTETADPDIKQYRVVTLKKSMFLQARRKLYSRCKTGIAPPL
jgi:hypothetical protein